MKTQFKYIAIFGLALTLVSCAGSGTENKSSDQEKTEMNDQRRSDAMSSSGLKLNDGQKWKVNPEMAKGIDKMNFILKEYDGKEPSHEMYKEISGRLMEQFDYILHSSTLEGDALAQLHNYMTSMKDYFEELNSNDLKVEETAVKKFKQHLDEFPKYFQ